MAHQEVKVHIDKKTGVLKMEGCGFEGDDCDVLTQIENHLGTITHTEDKSERYNYIQPDFLPNQIS